MTDLDLQDIRACLAGDQDAYARLVFRYEKQVASLMWRFTRDKQLLEELTQDVFVEAYFGLAGYTGKGAFMNWLWRIATRVGYRFWKNQAKNSQTASLPSPEFLADKHSENKQISADQAGEILTYLLSKLKPKDRLVLTLHYFQQLPFKEIAERTGWATAAVKMRAHRAKKKLKKIANEENLSEKLEWTI